MRAGSTTPSRTRRPMQGVPAEGFGTIKSIDWDGNPATIGAGDLPPRPDPAPARVKRSTPWGSRPHDPSNEKLQEFVRCAAMELESQGYFAIRDAIDQPIRVWSE